MNARWALVLNSGSTAISEEMEKKERRVLENKKER
jgi:hypothetical protein